MSPPNALDSAIIAALQADPKATQRTVRKAVGGTEHYFSEAVKRLRYAGKIQWERFALSPSLQLNNRGVSGAHGRGRERGPEGGLSNGPISERKSRTPDTAASSISPSAGPLPTPDDVAKARAGNARRDDRPATADPKLPARANRPGYVLLGKIELYCAATGTPETSIGRLLFRHDGFVGLLRKRGQLTDDKRIAVEQLMADHPKGLAGVSLPDQRLKEPKRLPSKVIKSAGMPDSRMTNDQLEELRQRSDEARSNRAPDESMADRFRRICREIDDEEAEALADLEAQERRERDLERLPTPSAVLRRAKRDWPEQCATVQALAVELGVGLGEAWRRTIAAGVQCLRESGDEGAVA